MHLTVEYGDDLPIMCILRLFDRLSGTKQPKPPWITLSNADLIFDMRHSIFINLGPYAWSQMSCLPIEEFGLCFWIYSELVSTVWKLLSLASYSFIQKGARRLINALGCKCHRMPPNTMQLSEFHRAVLQRRMLLTPVSTAGTNCYQS